MAVQDVRIVEFIKWERSMGVSQEIPNAQDYLTITYYDKIRVHPVQVDSTESPMQAAYRVMEQLPYCREERGYEFRQLIVGFADVDEPEDDFQRFWNERDCPLFFVTMVNISLNVKLEDEIKRIRAVLDGMDYRLYLTYEYDEILIFVKSQSFQNYAERVMKIGFHTANQGVLDTVTVCCFGDYLQTHEEEPITVCVQLGVKDYAKALKYLTSCKGMRTEDIQWVLGRNDIGFLLVESGLTWVYELCREYRTPERQNEFQWLSTTQFSLLVPNKKELTEELTGESVKTPWYAISEQQLDQIYPLYEAKCEKLHIHADPVFRRVLYETGSLVDNALVNQLSQDLAVCILPELKDFLAYLRCILTSPVLREKHAGVLRSSLDSFYLNVLALVNSTVHSNQEFVLIPHSAPPSFEMPPKVIAYYGLIVRQIIAAFQDDDRIYGVMLAPKLVDDLEVESFSEAELETLGHLLSVSIGERFLYNLRDTVMTLGHEMAHFVGETTRERNCRRRLILSFYLYLLLSQLCSSCLSLLPGQAEEELSGLVDSQALYVVADELSDLVTQRNQTDRPLMRMLPEEVKRLAGTVLYDPKCRNKILNEVILPLFNQKECRTYLAQHLSALLESPNDPGAETYLHARVERLFEQAERESLENWAASVEDEEFFPEYVGYLFTEAYADLAMALLFEMSLEEYIHIFSRGMGELEYHPDTAEDAIEMTRFLAVVRAAARTQEKWGCVDAGEDSWKWEDMLRNVACPACKWDILDFCQKNRIDVILATCLVKYLVMCAGSLKAHFNNEPQNAAVDALRKLHDEIEVSDTALSRISRIRERERACLNELVPPRPLEAK